MRFVVAVLMVVLIVPLLSCVEAEVKKPPAVEYDYNVYPAEIFGNTVEERIESFISVSNKKTNGFSVLLYEYNTEERIAAYHIMVYDKRQVLVVLEDDIALSSELNTIISQTFWYTGRLVPPGIEKIKIYYADTWGNLLIFRAKNSEIRQLPLGAWRYGTMIEVLTTKVEKEFPPAGYTPPPWTYY